MKYIWEICVCVLEELHSLHTGESTEDVCERLHGIWIGCPRGVHVGMYGERRGLYAALPCPDGRYRALSQAHRGLRAALASPTPRACLGPMHWHICLGTSKSGAGDLF